MPPGAVLDIPAGGAIQSRALARLGYRVVSVDLFAPARREPASGWICADANVALPFRDAAFDYVLSREGIEHLEDQMGFIRNCARVLKPGGKMVLTTPNLMHLSARASGFLTGQRNLRRGLMNEVQTPRSRNSWRIYHGHAFMLDYYRARYMLRLAGFDHLEVYTDRWSPTSVAMSPIVPILWLAMKFSAAASARTSRLRPGHRPPRDEVTREIIGHVLSPALLYGKRMVIVGERAESVADTAATSSAKPGRCSNSA
jgi:SAM-dependent methyltransferase